MKIIFYTNNLDPLFGGALFSQLVLIKEFVRRGIDVKIVVNKKRKREIEVPVPVLYLNAKYGDVERPFKLKSIIKREKPNAVLSNMLPQNITASITKLLYKRNDIKFIGIVRNASSYEHYGSIFKLPYRLFVKKMYENLDRVVGVSDDVVKDLKRTFSIRDDKLIVINNGIDIEEIRKKAEEELPEEYREIFNKNRILINVARLIPQKNQKVLIDTFELIKREFQNVKLVFVGEGHLRKELEEYSEKKGLKEDIIFTGFQENPFKFVKRADIFLLSSKFEGDPRVVKESFAVGTPVVAFKTKGMFDIIKSAGVVVEAYDKERFAKEVVSLLKDRERLKEYREKALKKSLEFDIKVFADKYLELIEG